MRAVRFHQFGGPGVLRFEKVAEPKVGPGDVLIRVAAAGVNASGEPGAVPGDVILTRNLSVLGLHLGRRPWRPDMHREAFVELIQLAAAGRITPVIDRTFRMAEVTEAHAHLAARKTTGKVLLIP